MAYDFTWEGGRKGLGLVVLLSLSLSLVCKDGVKDCYVSYQSLLRGFCECRSEIDWLDWPLFRLINRYEHSLVIKQASKYIP